MSWSPQQPTTRLRLDCRFWTERPCLTGRLQANRHISWVHGDQPVGGPYSAPRNNGEQPLLFKVLSANTPNTVTSHQTCNNAEDISRQSCSLSNVEPASEDNGKGPHHKQTRCCDSGIKASILGCACKRQWPLPLRRAAFAPT